MATNSETSATRLGAKCLEQRSISTAFAMACRHAKLIGVAPHVLRHTFASRLVMDGASLGTVQELGGLETLAMVTRYSHLNVEHKKHAIEPIGRKSELGNGGSLAGQEIEQPN